HHPSMRVRRRSKFRSTPLREGRHVSTTTTIHMALFRSTPLREGRRRVVHNKPGVYVVSIHAPARGATWDGNNYGIAATFRSTPLREGRPGVWLTSASNTRFDPRPCARGDWTWG